MKKLFTFLFLFILAFEYSNATEPEIYPNEIKFYINKNHSMFPIEDVYGAYINNFFQIPVSEGTSLDVDSEQNIVFTVGIPTKSLPSYPILPILTTPSGFSDWIMELKTSRDYSDGDYTYFDFVVHIKQLDVRSEFSLVLADGADWKKEFFILYAYGYKFLQPY